MRKLTLRDLFAVVTIVALALGWWLDRSRLVRKSRAQLEVYEVLKAELISTEQRLRREIRGAELLKKKLERRDRDPPSPSN